MASTNASKVRHAVFTGIDTNDLPLSFTSILLDVLAEKSSNGNDPNIFRDVLAQLAAVATPQSAAAMAYLRQAFNSAANNFGK